MNDFKKILKDLRIEKFVFLVSSLLNLSCNMYLVFVIKNLIDYITTNDSFKFEYFKVEVLKYFFMLFVFLFFVFLSNFFYSKMNKKGEFLIKNFFFKKLIFRKNLIEIDKGIISSHFLNDIKTISKWYSTASITILSQSIQFVTPLFIMMYYSFILTLSIFVFIVLSFYFQNIISKHIAKETKNLQNNIAKFNSFIISSLNNFKTILQLNKGIFFLDRFKNLNKIKIYDVDMRISLYNAFFVSLYVLLNHIVPFLVLGFGMYLVVLEKLTVGKLIAIYTLTSYLTEPIIVISDLLNQRNVSKNLFSNVRYMLDYEDKKCMDIGDFESLTVKSKYFSYDEGKRILENLNFKIAKGDVVKINGNSGSGKTTLINLISRFIESDNINIEYNGIDIKKIDKNKYYAKVMQVEQNPVMLDDSVYENIVLGDDFSKEDFFEVIDCSILKDFIDKNGKNFILEEDGKNISGGEKQRINLARILIRKPLILILDEVTSNLNRKMAKDLVKKLNNFIKKYNITVILISHNNDFDEIITKTINI